MRAAEPRDLPVLAAIHAGSGTPGLLSDIGPSFLERVYYRRLLASPVGRATVIEIGGHVGGFVTWSPDSGRLYRDIVPPVRTLRYLVPAGLRRLRLFRAAVESALHVERDARDVAPEIVSLEVQPALQGLGLGYFLLERAVGDLRASGATAIKARILDDFEAVEGLYRRLGFRREGTFKMQGRAWVMLVWRTTS
jgi:ribosomal protein S18 acetylase RimI-like enzyme